MTCFYNSFIIKFYGSIYLRNLPCKNNNSASAKCIYIKIYMTEDMGHELYWLLMKGDEQYMGETMHMEPECMLPLWFCCIINRQALCSQSSYTIKHH